VSLGKQLDSSDAYRGCQSNLEASGAQFLRILFLQNILRMIIFESDRSYIDCSEQMCKLF
jgi:hypothetical protein